MAENRELALVLKLVADQFQQELKNSQGALSSFNGFIKDWKTQLTAAGTALFAVAKSAANFGEEALKGAQKAGQTVETFTALSYAAKLADVDQQQLIVGLKTLSQNMVEAARNTGDGEALFRRLGVAATDAAGQLRPTEQVLLDLADVFAHSADGAGKTEAAVKLFGKAGLELVPFLNQGKAGIGELMAEAQRLGVVLSTEDAQAANKFNDEIKRLESAMRGLTLQLGNELLPTMTGGLEIFSSMIAKVRELGSETGTVGKNLKSMSDAFGQTSIGQGLMDAFTELGFGHRKGEGTLPREQFWFDLLGMPAPGSGVLAPAGGSGGGGGTKPQISQLADQEKLGKAKLEIFLAQNRAIDIGFDAESRRNAEARQAMEETYAAQKRIDDISGAKQEALGRAQREYDLAQQAMARNEVAMLAANAQAWLDYSQQVGASQEFIYTHQLDLVRANLAQQLDLNVETAGRLVIAWQNKDEELAKSILDRTKLTATERETIELQTLAKIAQANQQASDDVFEGWYRGMQRYVADVKSGFGMAADLARRTAQSMESSFRTFFFDLFEGKIQSFKDVLRSLLDFVKQVAAQIASQLAVAWILKSVTGGGGMFTGSDTGWVNNIGEFFGMDFTTKHSGGYIEPRRFAFGGSVLGAGNQDTVRALLTPGEGVLSRRGMATLDQLNAGNLPGGGAGNVTVNVIGAPPDSTPVVDVRRTTDSMVIDVLLRHQRDLRPLFGGA